MIHKLVIAPSVLAAAGLTSPLYNVPLVLADGSALPMDTAQPRILKRCMGPCDRGATIPKESVVYDDNCAPFSWQVPHRIIRFTCTQERCFNGSYYLRTISTDGDCTDAALYDNKCPGNTCED